MTKILHILSTEKYNDAVMDVLEKIPKESTRLLFDSK